MDKRIRTRTRWRVPAGANGYPPADCGYPRRSSQLSTAVTEDRVAGADLPSHQNEWLLLSLVLVAHLHVVSGLSRADSNITLVTLKSILHSFDKQRNTQTLASFPIDV
ncbi:hypothetical protein PSTG_00044 [Puccinia striiformis f. sp. tritici PST-78]|uniref:Uncharacterized protein n=1 Tax=Puccinia striiformis f. sp. tritici PST-78 TaxID=1165861 RepID=A0A0L0W5D3_9BASI|nr:hypothetical protein PSTG_00044 [Puccinia striiformis f. sp. tritici PST-78]